MRFPRSILTVAVGCLLLAGCAESAGDETASYVVQAQDTLYSIAWRHNLDFRDLARWNHIGADFRIAVGQVLLLGPKPTAPNQSPAQLNANTLPQVVPPRVPPPRVPPPRVPSRVAAPTSGPSRPRPNIAGTAQRWVWPTDHAAARPAVSGGGILLFGLVGQDVRAASDGRVVYIGNGLRGYGNLIIIKHGDSLLSAYAHNREMLVREGQDVKVGEVIAHMGEDAHQAASLYFEIRQNGRAVDPLAFLTDAK